MENVLGRWLASLCIAFSLFAPDKRRASALREEDLQWSGAIYETLRGKLIKRHFSAPRVVKTPPFGWFIELDLASQEKISDLFSHLSPHEQKLHDDLDLQYVRLLTDRVQVREWARAHCNEEVTIEGEISEPDLFGRELQAFHFTPDRMVPKLTLPAYLDDPLQNSIPYNWEEDHDDSLVLPDDEPERLVSMTGKLYLEILNLAEHRDTESGGHPSYCWMLKLDPYSFETACSTPVRAPFQTPGSIRASRNGDTVWLTGNYNLEWLCDHIDQTVTVLGYLWHAHTGHHHTPVMLDTDPWFIEDLKTQRGL